MKQSFILVILGAFLFGGTARAQAVNDSDKPLIEKIRQANATHATVVSRFKQTKHVSVLGEDVYSDGKFYYDKPDKLAMRYDHPAGDLMLINGDRFVMVNGGKRREASSKSNVRMRGMKSILSACLQGDVTQIEASRVRCEDAQGYYKITAEINEKATKSNIRKVVLSFDKNSLVLSVLRTEEKDGSYTVYELSGQEFDTAIDETFFQADKKKGNTQE